MHDLRLSKELYSQVAIFKAQNAFKQITSISITETETEFLCDFTVHGNYPVSITIMEFENYIIDYINSEKIYECI